MDSYTNQGFNTNNNNYAYDNNQDNINEIQDENQKTFTNNNNLKSSNNYQSQDMSAVPDL